MTQQLSDLYLQLLNLTGENPKRDGLLDTPHRAAKAWQYLTQGYHQNLDQIVNGALFACDNNDLVIVKDIELFSICEHHLLPIVGRCHIGYKPNNKIIGLSKIARIVDMFARRLQIQERLTKEIGQAIMKVTDSHGVGVVIEASHMCMIMRGVEKQHPQAKTIALLGEFKTNQETKQEFFKLLNSDHQ